MAIFSQNNGLKKKKKINDNNLLVRKGVLNHSGFFYINFCLQNSKVIPV